MAGRVRCARVPGGRRCAASVNEVNDNNPLVSGA